MQLIWTLLFLSLGVVYCHANAVPTTFGQALTGINGNFQPVPTPPSHQLVLQHHVVNPPVRNDFAQDLLIHPEDIHFETPGVPKQVGAQIISQIRAQLGNKPILLSELNKRNMNISAELPGIQINRTVVTTIEESLLNKTSRMSNNGGSYVSTSYLPPTQVKGYQEANNKQQVPQYYGQYAPQPSYVPQYKPKESTGYAQVAKEPNYVYKAPETVVSYTPELTQSYKLPEPTTPTPYLAPPPAVPSYQSVPYATPVSINQYAKPAPTYASPIQDSKVVIKYIEVCTPSARYELPKLPNLDKYSDKINGVPDLKKSLKNEYQQLNEVYAQMQKSLTEVNKLQEHLEHLKEAQSAYQEALSAYEQMSGPLNEAQSVYTQMAPPFKEVANAYDSVAKPYQEANTVYGQAAGAYQEAQMAYDQAQKTFASKSYPSPLSPSPPPPMPINNLYQPNVYRKEYVPSTNNYQPTYNNGQSYAPPKLDNSYDGNQIKVSYRKTEESLKTNNTATNYYK